MFCSLRYIANLFREHVNLLGFLDYEIWKASHMLATDLPLGKSEDSNLDTKYQIWEDFGFCWSESGTCPKEITNFKYNK